MAIRPLISIITPVYNAGRFIEDTIKSVQAQTYENWEIILIDDKSTDNSAKIIEELQKADDRIKLLKNTKNIGVARTRNAGLMKAKGDFLAYLDADDIWNKDKLKKQLYFMISQKHIFTFTSYDFINVLTAKTGVVAKAPTRVSFYDYLKSNIIWTSTVMVDLRTVVKSDLKMKDLNYGEDALVWLCLLNKYGDAFGMSDVLASYRRGSVSLSSNKLKAIANKFGLYQSIQQINAMQGVWYFILSTVAAARKRL